MEAHNSVFLDSFAECHGSLNAELTVLHESVIVIALCYRTLIGECKMCENVDKSESLYKVNDLELYSAEMSALTRVTAVFYVTK